MKKALFMIVLSLGIVACGNGNAKSESKTENQEKSNVVEVLYFHGKQRCTTCMAIENNTKELVESAFGNELKSGELIFESVDITEKEELADKYEVSWSSLIVIDHDELGKENVVDMTEFAFGNALTTPDIFKNGVAEQIRKMLND